MKLALIDRDGVINDELPNYVKTVEELVLLKPALDGLARLHEAGFTCVVITNQSVVGRGIISMAALNRIHDYMRETVRAHGGHIEDVIVCTDTPDKATYRRKPGAGMLLEALQKYKAEAGFTPFIGDALTDMEAAFAAGCPRFLVKTGKGARSQATVPPSLLPVTACADLDDAARRIIPLYGARA